MVTNPENWKRERNIKTRRIPNDLHERLCKFQIRHRYETLFGAMMAAADKYISIEEAGGYVAIKIAHNRTPVSAGGRR